jgi:hypothetical protein
MIYYYIQHVLSLYSIYWTINADTHDGMCDNIYLKILGIACCFENST